MIQECLGFIQIYYEKGGMFSIIRDFLDFRTLLRAKNVLVKKHFRETDREKTMWISHYQNIIKLHPLGNALIDIYMKYV